MSQFTSWFTITHDGAQIHDTKDGTLHCGRAQHFMRSHYNRVRRDQVTEGLIMILSA